MLCGIGAPCGVAGVGFGPVALFVVGVALLVGVAVVFG